MTNPQHDYDDLIERLQRCSPFGHSYPLKHRLIDNATFDEAISALQAAKEMKGEIGRLNAIIDTPETNDFFKGISIEAEHQIRRWGKDHDKDKTAWDWFWLIGYLSQKAAGADNEEKFRHHAITTSAAIYNWFLSRQSKTKGEG